MRWIRGRATSEQTAGASHAGRRARNEDAFAVRRLADGRLVVVVADGIGGTLGGDVAARRSCEVIPPLIEGGASLEEAILEANEVILREAASDDRLRDMGSTVVVACCERDTVSIAHVGDSRAYLVDDLDAQQLTTDHSYLAARVADGSPNTEDDAPFRNAITRSLGSRTQCQVDVRPTFQVEVPSSLVLCTDGVYKDLPDARLARITREAATVKQAAEALAAFAFDAGSNDNLTAVVVDLGGVTVRTAGRLEQFVPLGKRSRNRARSSTPRRVGGVIMVTIGIAAMSAVALRRPNSKAAASIPVRANQTPTSRSTAATLGGANQSGLPSGSTDSLADTKPMSLLIRETDGKRVPPPIESLPAPIPRPAVKSPGRRGGSKQESDSIVNSPKQKAPCSRLLDPNFRSKGC